MTGWALLLSVSTLSGEPRPPGPLSFEERPAYFETIARVGDTPASALCERAAAVAESRRQAHEAAEPTAYSQFGDMLAEPQFWVGRPVRLRGHANLVRVYAAGDNAAGVDTLYESWIVSDDSMQYPSVVISRGVPAGATAGEATLGGLEVCGEFFKLLTYRARDGQTRYAPLIMADRVRFAAAETVTAGELALVGLAAVMGLSLAWHTARAMRRRPGRRVTGPPPDVSFPTRDDAPASGRGD